VSLTLRPRWWIVLLGLAIVGAAAMVIAGAGLMVAVPLIFAAIFAWMCRQSLHLDDAGVRYRSFVPSEDFSAPWSDVTQVVVDVISTSTPGNPGGNKARARFLSSASASRVAILFTEADADRVVEACRSLGVDVVDDRRS
jgi:hypothetical protein